MISNSRNTYKSIFGLDFDPNSQYFIFVFNFFIIHIRLNKVGHISYRFLR